MQRLGENSTVTFRVNGAVEQVRTGACRSRGDAGCQWVNAEDGQVAVGGPRTHVDRAAVQAALWDHGLDVVGVDVAEPDLEAVFLHLTGKALRD